MGSWLGVAPLGRDLIPPWEPEDWLHQLKLLLRVSPQPPLVFDAFAYHAVTDPQRLEREFEQFRMALQGSQPEPQGGAVLPPVLRFQRHDHTGAASVSSFGPLGVSLQQGLEPFQAEMYSAALEFADKQLAPATARLRRLLTECPLNGTVRARVHHALAVGLMEQGDLSQARRELIRALWMSRRSGPLALAIDAWDDLGLVRLYQGFVAAALRSHRWALRLAYRMDDPRRVARLWEHLGWDAWRAGDATTSLPCLLRAFSVRVSQPAKSDLADSLDSLGRICRSLHLLHLAVSLHWLSLRLRIAQEDRAAVAKTWTDLGVVFRSAGQLSSALRCHQQAMEIRRRFRDKVGLANSHNNLGLVLHQMGKTRPALKHLRKALRLRSELGDWLNISRNLKNLRQIGRRKRFGSGRP